MKERENGLKHIKLELKLEALQQQPENYGHHKYICTFKISVCSTKLESLK